VRQSDVPCHDVSEKIWLDDWALENPLARMLRMRDLISTEISWMLAGVALSLGGRHDVGIMAEQRRSGREMFCIAGRQDLAYIVPTIEQ